MHVRRCLYNVYGRSFPPQVSLHDRGLPSFSVTGQAAFLKICFNTCGTNFIPYINLREDGQGMSVYNCHNVSDKKN